MSISAGDFISKEHEHEGEQIRQWRHRLDPHFAEPGDRRHLFLELENLLPHLSNTSLAHLVEIAHREVERESGRPTAGDFRPL